MRKVLTMAFLVASAIVANAQRGNDRNRANDYDRYYDRPNRVENYDRIDNYQREARREIARGIETGQISSRESKRLLREVEKIEMKENRFKRDGRLDVRERRELGEDLAMLNRWINLEKRDRERSNYDDFSRNVNNNSRYDDRYGKRF